MSYVGGPTYVNGTVILIAGSASAVVIAAPGALLRIRIVSILVGVDRLIAAGLVTVRVFGTTSGLNPIPSIGLNMPGQASLAAIPPEPGIPLAVNESVTLSTSSTVATGNVSCVIGYLVDHVS